MEKSNVWKLVHSSIYMFICLIIPITFVVTCPHTKVANAVCECHMFSECHAHFSLIRKLIADPSEQTVVRCDRWLSVASHKLSRSY